MLDLRTKTRNWYASPVAETKHLPKPHTGFAPIRFRYRGIEFFGKVAVRVFDPVAALSLTAPTPPANQAQRTRSQRRTARQSPYRRTGPAAKRGR
jgi:hypothetical protein